jgi:Mg2+/Co2+ transporter CorC
MEDSPGNRKPSWLDRLGALLMREPEDREHLVELLRSAHSRNLLDGEALSMIEGALQVSEMKVRDVMIPRAQMDVIDVNETPDRFVPAVIGTGHSRFPVIDRDRDHVIVGDIEDEYDFDELEDNVLREKGGRWRVKAQTEIADINQVFGTAFPDDEFDTIGGLVIHRFGRLPKRGESIALDGLKFTVLRADSRRLYTLQVERSPGATA